MSSHWQGELGGSVWSFDPETQWDIGQPAPYSLLSECFRLLEATTKRLAIGAALTNAFRSLIALAPADLLPALYLCVDKIGPPYTQHPSKEVGHTIIVRALPRDSEPQEIFLGPKKYLLL